MTHLYDYQNGIYALDAEYDRPLLAAIHLVVDQGHVAIIDTGNNQSLQPTLQALSQLRLEPESVDYIFLTHVHLDHAGGAGVFMREFSRAKLVVHERGVRHMIDPSRLMAGVRAVYGQARTQALYGELVAVPEGRILVAHEGMCLPLGSRKITCLDTPGHARHHLCYHDPAAKAVFTGDTFGLSYRELDVGMRQFILPTSSPVQFDPQAMHESIERILALEPTTLYLTHFAQIHAPQTLAKDLHRLIDAYVEIAQCASGDRIKILEGLWQLCESEARLQGWTVPQEKWREMLKLDMELNAQGLEVWFKAISNTQDTVHQ